MYKTLHKKQGSVTVQLRFARSSVTFCAKRDNKDYITPENIHNPGVTLSLDNLEYLCEDCHNKEHKAKPNNRYRFDSDGKLLPPKEEKRQTTPPGGLILDAPTRTEGDTSKKLRRVARI